MTALVLCAVVLGALLHFLLSAGGPERPAIGDSSLPDGYGGLEAPLSEADGLVPGGAAAFDDGIPAVSNLAPDLHDALRMAVSDAADTGIGISITSGWRSRQYQEQLLQDAIADYGSETEAARWVATPDTSAHVSGDAVDVGPMPAAQWLSAHGAHYGLCQIYDNEPWHYELRPDARLYGCPARYADPSQWLQ